MMMQPGFRDPYNVPEHVREIYNNHPPLGFFSATKGKLLEIQICGTCGMPALVSSRDLEDKEAPNLIKSMYWMARPESCPYCGPIFARYPEIALWITQFVAWHDFVQGARQ